jgi:hypothetical protein
MENNENNGSSASAEEILFKYPLSFSKSSVPFGQDESEKGKGDEKFEGSVQLYKEYLVVSAPGFTALKLHYRDIDKALGRQYKLYIDVVGGLYFKLYEIGYEYENFLKNFFYLRNEIIIKDLLMKEKILRPYVEGEFEEKSTDGKSSVKGECLIRIYETAVVVVPKVSQIKRYPFGLIDSINGGNYKIIIKMEDGAVLELSMLGYEFETLLRDIIKANDVLVEKTQQLIKEISPSERSLEVSQLSSILKDGRAAQKDKICAISPEFFSKIEEKLKDQKVRDYYSHLQSISEMDKTCIGIKKGLFGEMTGYYLWFLFPLSSGQQGSFSNCIALEAMTIAIQDENKGQETGTADQSLQDSKNMQTQEDADAVNQDEIGFQTGGRATYIFRMIDRAEFAKQYKSGKKVSLSSAGIGDKYDGFIRKINKCMLAINFRREPVYMTDDQLALDSNTSYRYAVNMIPELSWLREIFTGRVIHKDAKTWQNDLKEILEFNLNSVDNFLKWQKK